MKKSPSRPAFYLDENIPQYFGQVLRSQGCNVTFASDRPGLTDLTQFRLAIRDGRIFVSHDRDFLSQPFTEQRIPISADVVILSTDDPSDERYKQLANQLLVFIDHHRINGRICLVSAAGIRLVPKTSR